MKSNSSENAKKSVGLPSLISAGAIGTIMEWYIFFIFTTGAVYLVKNFFPTSINPALGFVSLFLVYAIGFFFRPLGGFIFGHLGDRIGRNTTLILTITLAGLSGGLIGVLPTYEEWGWTSVIILATLRAISGISLGGEWGGAMLLSLENIGVKMKAFFSSFIQSTVGIGLLLGAIIYKLTLLYVGSEAMYTFGWRIPFLVSFLILLVGIFLRLRIPETRLFTSIKEQNKIEKNPIGKVFKRYPKELILGIFISGVGGFFAFGTSVYPVLFEVKHIITVSQAFDGLIIAGLSQIIFTFLSGIISDRIGRRPILIISAVLFLFLVYPGILILKPITFYIYSVLFPMTMAIGYAANGVILAELFPTEVRYTGISLTYQIGNAYITGPTALVSQYFEIINILLLPLWGIIIAIGMIVATILVPETKNVNLETIEKR